ncbi:hypothetical protein DYY67_0335 [Candidatus Nitrosotalea sp. TS]|uniref:hypothetical protein n=1 Tax=Candidatus Nitrosotalea sp. TS TaxID=2341020 RepID=UPI00140C0323|nr:hypothetical protein [Candidatus Nitrosotalea sp. TS]NHI04577.1 hypothetical protein [Candidatus Nitrosotalea sp. TS]
MPLSPEFKKYLEETIHGVIIGIPTLKKEYPKFKNDWKFSSEFDFLYGCIVGQILGSQSYCLQDDTQQRSQNG